MSDPEERWFYNSVEECSLSIHTPGFNSQSVSVPVCLSVCPISREHTHAHSPAHALVRSVIQYYKGRKGVLRNVTEKMWGGFKTLSVWGFDQRGHLRVREALARGSWDTGVDKEMGSSLW